MNQDFLFPETHTYLLLGDYYFWGRFCELQAVAAFLRGGADRRGVAALPAVRRGLGGLGGLGGLRALEGLDECSRQLCSVIGEI